MFPGWSLGVYSPLNKRSGLDEFFFKKGRVGLYFAANHAAPRRRAVRSGLTCFAAARELWDSQLPTQPSSWK